MRGAPPRRHVPVQPVLVDVRVRPARPAGLNTYQSLIVPNIASALGAFLFRRFFLGVPAELGEAARIDRTGELTGFLTTAAALIAIVPVLAVAVTAQRHIIEGITLGALD